MTVDTLATSTLHILQPRKYKNQLMNNSPAFYHSDGMDNISEEILMSRLSQNTQHDTWEISKVKSNSFIEETKFINNKVKCCWKNCGLYFETLEFLANHLLKVHANSKPCGLYYCEWEGCTRTKGFTARYKMLVHARTHTNEKPHHCYLCSKSFSRAENLKIHKRSHNGEKPYICPVIGCNKAYSNSSDRFKHTKTHQVEKPYVCKIPGCSKRYTDPSSLRKHAKTYKHYSCNQILEQSQVQLVKQESTSIKEIIEDTTRNFCINTRFNSYPTQTYMIQSPELLNFGAFLDYNDTYIRDTYWRKFLEPFTYFKLENKDYLNGYRNIDLPLDLTVNRK